MSGTKGLKITAIPANAATQEYSAARAARIAARHATAQMTRGPIVSMSAVMCQKAIPVIKTTPGAQLVIPRETNFNPGSNITEGTEHDALPCDHHIFSTARGLMPR
jgi:hypothetical protein